MTKCVRCGTKKGKRACPALDGLLCPTCCASIRIVEVKCPPDCRYLEGAFDRERRSMQRVMGRSEEYLALLARLFPSGDDSGAVHEMNALLHAYGTTNPQPANGEIARALQHVRRETGTIVTPGLVPTRLGAWLLEAMQEIDGRAEKNPRASGMRLLRMDAASRTRILERLAEHLLLAPESKSWMKGLSLYFEAFDREREPVSRSRPERTSRLLLLPDELDSSE